MLFFFCFPQKELKINSLAKSILKRCCSKMHLVHFEFSVVDENHLEYCQRLYNDLLQCVKRNHGRVSFHTSFRFILKYQYDILDVHLL